MKFEIENHDNNINSVQFGTAANKSSDVLNKYITTIEQILGTVEQLPSFYSDGIEITIKFTKLMRFLFEAAILVRVPTNLR